MKKFILPIAIVASAVLGVSAFAYAATGGLGSSSLASSNNNSTSSTQTSKCLPKKARTHANSAADNSCRKNRAKLIKRRIAKVLRNSVQDQFIVRGKNNTWVTVNVERGTVGSISSTSITVNVPDGNTVTAPITSATKFAIIKEANIVAGDRVIVVEKNNSSVLIVTMKPKSQTGSSSSSQGASSALNLNSVSA